MAGVGSAVGRAQTVGGDPPVGQSHTITSESTDVASASPAHHEETPQQPAAQDEKRVERVLGIVPVFTVTDDLHAAPLIPRQKFQLFVDEMTDPFTFAAGAIEAGLGQVQNDPAVYGQGVGGFAKRFATGYADNLSQPFFTAYLMPVLLKQDPRYFRLGSAHPGGQRVMYAVTRVVVTRNDDRSPAFNWSKILGTLASCALSNAYYPADERGATMVGRRAAFYLSTGAAFQVLVEFWPDIRNIFARVKDHPTVTRSSPRTTDAQRVGQAEAVHDGSPPPAPR